MRKQFFNLNSQTVLALANLLSEWIDYSVLESIKLSDSQRLISGALSV